MTAAVPDGIAWPLIIFTAIIVVVRYQWFNLNQYERYMNNALALALVIYLLRERIVQNLFADSGLLSVPTVQQLSLVAIILAHTELMGFVSLWSTASLSETHRCHRRHQIAAAILVVGFLASGTRARVEGQLLELSGGWDGLLAWGLYAVMPMALGTQLFRMCVKEVRRPDIRRREQLLTAGGMVLSVAFVVIALFVVFLKSFERLGWMRDVHYLVTGHSFLIFWVSVSATCFAAIPCVLNLIAFCGLDRVSRDCRKLSLLRENAVAAVPEVAFQSDYQSLGRRKTMLELHQTTVQIRDAILQLRRYFGDIDSVELLEFFERSAVPVDQHREAALALQLAYAARAKRAGAAGATLDASVVSNSRPTTLEGEVAELLKLSRWWPHTTRHNMNAEPRLDAGS